MDNGEVLDSFDRLSLNSLSKSSPSTFQVKSSSRLIPPPPPPLLDKKSSNLSHVPCKFFKQGTCTAGSNCIFSHNLDPTSESSVCKYFRKGNCKFGTKCALLHTLSPFTSTSKNTTSPPIYSDPFALSAPSPSPFSLFNSCENDVDSFILPSSLNDLLTPTELRKQQIPTIRNNNHLGYLSSSSNSYYQHYRQPSFEPTPSWNAPFYTEPQHFSSNAINIPGSNTNRNHHLQHFQHDFLPNTNNSQLFEDDDEPFIMEDTSLFK